MVLFCLPLGGGLASSPVDALFAFYGSHSVIEPSSMPRAALITYWCDGVYGFKVLEKFHDDNSEFRSLN